MPDNWETYKDWKELMENIRKKPQVEEPVYDFDDDVSDLTESFRDYID